MASKKDTLTLGYGCISCGHNKDINLYKDMYKMSTERNADHAEEGAEFLKELKNLIVTLSDILGLIVEKEEEMLDTDIEQLIAERQAARKAKNFARADEIRDELLAKGIVLKDTREGVVWTRA